MVYFVSRFLQRVLLDYLAVNGGETDHATMNARHFYICQWYRDANASTKKAKKVKKTNQTNNNTKKNRKRRKDSSSESSEEEVHIFLSFINYYDYSMPHFKVFYKVGSEFFVIKPFASYLRTPKKKKLMRMKMTWVKQRKQSCSGFARIGRNFLSRKSFLLDLTVDNVHKFCRPTLTTKALI